MKQTFKLLSMLLAVFAMNFTFTSCGDDDEPTSDTEFKETIVGTWVEKDSDIPFTLILNADHTGSISYDTSSRALMTDRFTWSTSTTSSGVNILNTIHTSGDLIFRSVQNQYVLAGNELILLFDFGTDGVSYQANFTRR